MNENVNLDQIKYMTQKEKELLLYDMSARLPYGLKCKCPILSHETYTIVSIELNGYPMVRLNTTRDSYIYAPLEEVKPYLRPMSSMTEEESKEFALLQTDFYVDGFLYPIAAGNMINWLNKHHFDYCGLIQKDLALEAPKDMYYVDINTKWIERK